ncbi:MAG TPA: IgGFc-binding protein [Labilithrix sp.]
MDRLRLRFARRHVLTLGALALGAACKFDPAYRDVPDPGAVPCTEGVVECGGSTLERCENGTRVTIDDCGAKMQVCAPGLLACTPCLPGLASCDGVNVIRCSQDGQTQNKEQTCDATQGQSCRDGACINLCAQAAQQHSNVGCEYWGVDLDNADVPSSPNQGGGNAAAQQYAIVVSNAEPDLSANVVVEEDTAAPGQPNMLRTIATARVGPHALEVFKLGPKEVDGSTPGTFNTGTGTALSRGAFRVRSDVPIVAYQFNPLDNVNVFSNDASLLFPTPALGGGGRTYVVAGWPQTIATSSDPSTNFGEDLRVFLAFVGTKPDTHVHLKTAARVIPGGPFSAGIDKGAEVDFVLQPFDVLNLETGDFNADFTGSLVDTDGPVALFVGSEASDAPFFATLADRACCADHLESQLSPIRAIGQRYVLGRMPNRSRAIEAAGGKIFPFDEPEFYRVVAVRDGTTKITTSLPPPNDSFELDGEGANRTIAAHQDFTLTATLAVSIADVQASQEAAGVVRGLPGGDPSLSFPSPIEQWRNDYVLLTPDKYAFDFLVITAPFGAHVFLDGLAVDGKICESGPGDGLDPMTRKKPNPDFVVYRCQLSFPAIDPNVTPPRQICQTPDEPSCGRQNDGVHHVQSDLAVGVVAYGFDSFVSYAYAGGTELRDLNPQ